MKVRHQDSVGKCWEFDVPLKPLQANVFARFLRYVRDFPKKELEGHLRPEDFRREIEVFGRDVEKIVLSALSECYPNAKLFD